MDKSPADGAQHAIRVRALIDGQSPSLSVDHCHACPDPNERLTITARHSRAPPGGALPAQT